MKVVWLFFRIGLLRFDTIDLVVLVRESLVSKLGLLQDEEVDDMLTLLRVSFGSSKLTLAFLVGQKLGSLIWSVGLMLVVTLPSFILMSVVLQYGLRFLSLQQRTTVVYGIIPVLAAVFVVKAIDFAKRAKVYLSWVKWFIYLLIAVVLVVVFRLPMAIVLLGMMLLSLSFMRGGLSDD